MRIYISKDQITGNPVLPTQGFPGDAGWDLYTSRFVVIPPHAFEDVHTDISVALPGELWGFITGRSSTVRNRGLRVENGTIDSGYRGELFVGVWNLTDMPVEVSVHTRLAQLILIPHTQPLAWWVEVDSLPSAQRGTNGFGSTG